MDPSYRAKADREEGKQPGTRRILRLVEGAADRLPHTRVIYSRSYNAHLGQLSALDGFVNRQWHH